MTNMLPRLNRDQRVQAAKQTVAICAAGRYVSPSGRTVEIAGEIKCSVEGTQVHTNVSKRPLRNGHDTVFEVTGETTFDAIQRLSSADCGHLACLNFASAKNPGGGFLSGAQTVARVGAVPVSADCDRILFAQSDEQVGALS